MTGKEKISATLERNRRKKRDKKGRDKEKHSVDYSLGLFASKHGSQGKILE